MAKKKSNNLSLVITLVIVALCVVTLCTLFMPIVSAHQINTDASVAATGADMLSAAFASEWSSEMSEGTMWLYSMKTAEEYAFITTVYMWSYMITLLVSAATLVFSVLSLLGMRFKLVNTILGACLVVLALVVFVLSIVVAVKNTSITEVLGVKTGVKAVLGVGAYMLLGTMLAGGAQVYKARS